MILYNIGIWLLGGAMRLAAPFNRKARLWVDGRKGIFKELRQAIVGNDRVVWIHCASLGEFEQGRPIIEQIKREYPYYKIMLTFYSPSGYEVRKSYEGADFIFYLPLDTPRNAKRFLQIVRPEVAIFVKYEYWLNYLKQLRKSSCKTYIISAIFRENSIFFKPYGGLFRRALTSFDELFVQDRESKELLSTIGIERVTIAGDTRFDRVAEVAKRAQKLKIVENFLGNRESKVFIAGSSWQPDEELIMKLIDEYPAVKFIVAPHEMEEDCISAMAINHNAVRYTKCSEGDKLADFQLLIIDTIGLLSSIYQYGDIGYIGGGFGEGIHNTLEAATFGIPIAFGPNYHKFREAHELIDAGAAKSITDYSELKTWFDKLLTEREAYDRAHQSALQYIKRNRGATEQIMRDIFTPSN